MNNGGYTPVFGTIFSGSLYGRYPDTAAWVFMLALADWRGHIDMTPEAIAGMTGMPLDVLMGCIERFCSPDPRSRSKAEQGRRLALIDPERPWGWRVINIQKYRDKASGADQIADGRNALKVKRYKDRHRRTPEDTARHSRTPTHTHTQTKTEEGDKSAPAALVLPDGLDLESWRRWIKYRAELKKPVKPASLESAARRLASFGVQQAEVVEQSIANGWQGLFPLGRAAPTAPAPSGPRWTPAVDDEVTA